MSINHRVRSNQVVRVVLFPRHERQQHAEIARLGNKGLKGCASRRRSRSYRRHGGSCCRGCGGSGFSVVAAAVVGATVVVGAIVVVGGAVVTGAVVAAAAWWVGREWVCGASPQAASKIAVNVSTTSRAINFLNITSILSNQFHWLR